MPALKKFDANRARHLKLMNKNLCANLIRNEYIVTGRTKAKRAQDKIESFLSRTLHKNREMQDKPLEYKMKNIKTLNYLQPPDKREVGTKVLEELSKRYPDRTHGFTRIIKLEPRLGEDKAPMSVLELVDSDFEIKLWYTAKIVARLELQNLPLDAITEHNVRKLTQLRVMGAERFREAVEEAKAEFFSYDKETGTITSEAVTEDLKNVPSEKFYEDAKEFGKSKKLDVQVRSEKPLFELPKSPFLK